MEKLEFRLGYDTDIIKVKKIIRKIGEELMAHPEIGPQLLQPLKSQGVAGHGGQWNDTSTDSKRAEPSLYATPMTVTAPAFSLVPGTGSRM